MNKIENREYPEEMIKLCGFTSIPNAIIWRSFEESVYVKMILIHMLSKPAEWVFYFSMIEEETGISKSTVYKAFNESLHKYMDIQYVATGKYGSGFIVNFAKLYARCYEIGVEKQKISATKKHDDALKNQFVHQKDNSFRMTEGSFRAAETSFRQTSTTNTDTNTDSNNTKEQYCLTNAEKDRKDFQSVESLRNASPNGSRSIFESDKKKESDIPVDQEFDLKESDIPVDQIFTPKDTDLPEDSEDQKFPPKESDLPEDNRLEDEDENKYFEDLFATVGVTKDNINYQTTETVETNKFANHLLNSLFSYIDYTPLVKRKLLAQLQAKPSTELKLIIDNFAQWKYWCLNVASEHGLTQLKTSDFGLPLLMIPAIYTKFISYIHTIQLKDQQDKAEKRALEDKKLEEARHAEEALQKLHFIESMSQEEKLRILSSFRFDLMERYKFIYEAQIETILKTNKVGLDEDSDMLYEILNMKYNKKYYEGRSEILEMRDKLVALPEKDIFTKLKSFNFLLSGFRTGIRDCDLEGYAKKRHINWDYKMLYDIVFDKYPPENYKEQIKKNKENILVSKEFEENLVRSLNEE